MVSWIQITSVHYEIFFDINFVLHLRKHFECAYGQKKKCDH